MDARRSPSPSPAADDDEQRTSGGGGARSGRNGREGGVGEGGAAELGRRRETVVGVGI
uniref:Uncharacterized protein n=1 Tax=Aegilops tauschii TaxID=37682 RepID=M8D915_AEGTA